MAAVDGREMLAKLTAGTVKPGIGGRGGLPVYQGVELAGVLSGLSEHARNLALWRYCGQDGLRPFIFWVAYDKVLRLAESEKWRIGNKSKDQYGKEGYDILWRMTAAALFEVVEYPWCVECNGSGVVFVKGEVDCRCKFCLGDGRARLPAASVARAINRSLNQYHMIWKPRYNVVFDMVNNWVRELEWDITEVLRKNMRLIP